MLKRCFWPIVLTVLLAFQFISDGALALSLDEETRTVKLNDAGETVVITLQEAKRGQTLFANICAQCHPQGLNKTNPNVKLGLADLKGAEPPRDSIEGLVDYLNNPTTYDGLIEIAEFHPATISADIYPEMRNLTQDDLFEVAGHILIQPKLRGTSWGGSKVNN